MDWLQQLRVPPCDEILAQFHRLKAGGAPQVVPAHLPHLPTESDAAETIPAVRMPHEEPTARPAGRKGSVNALPKSPLEHHEGGPP